MKKSFLFAILAIFSTCQIEASRDLQQDQKIDFLPSHDLRGFYLKELYSQIEANDYKSAHDTLLKYYNIIGSRELSILSQIVKNKRKILEQELKNSSVFGFYAKKTFKTLGFATAINVSVLFCTGFSAAALYHGNVKEQLNNALLYLENCEAKTRGTIDSIIEHLKNKKYRLNDKTVCYGALTLAALSMLAAGLNTKNLFSTIWANKRTDIKNMIKEIEKLELLINNHLLILNQQSK